MRPPKLPSVIERNPSAANAREVIHAAERGERLWREGDEGIVQPIAKPSATPFLDAWRAEERAMDEAFRRSFVGDGS